MRAGGKGPALDRFRLLAAILVVCVHTSPLASYTAAGDFWLTRVLGRVAVPFFLMCSGYFLARDGWHSTGRFWKKTAALYGICILLYLPLNWYAGQLTFPGYLLRLVTDGAFYHLWYFPALLVGVPIACFLRRFGMRPALSVAALLYLVGLGGDSYYGFLTQVPPLERCYAAFFQLFSYTRNGIFYVPLFLLLGAAVPRLGRRLAGFGTLAGLALMTAEAFWLRSLGVQRHDSMYLSLPLVMLFLFSLLLCRNQGQRRDLRKISALLYLLHPWCIVLVRGAAGAVGGEALLVQNSLVHFLAVLALSGGLSYLLWVLRPRQPQPKGRAWREVDSEALAHNAAVLQRQLAPGQSLMAVVKADAYGHGAAWVARCLQRQGVHAFAVACLAEGIALRRAGIRGTVLILGCTDPRDAALLRRYRLTQTVADAAHGRALAAQGRRIHVHLALDTGMRRLGIPAEDHAVIAELYQYKTLSIDGVFSHLCVSDSLEAPDGAYTQGQLDTFYQALAWMRAAGYNPGATHIQASYGLMNLTSQPCRYARAGIALYGVLSQDSPVLFPPDIRPVLSLRARIASLRTLRPGEAAGYGLAFRATRPTRLAVVTIGYADGLPRSLPQQGGQALVRGRRCPMAGRMCMDQLLLDVTDMPEARPGDTVTLIGRDGACQIRAEDLAAQCGTITNELLSRLSSRLPLAEPGGDIPRPWAGETPPSSPEMQILVDKCNPTVL